MVQFNQALRALLTVMTSFNRWQLRVKPLDSFTLFQSTLNVTNE